MKFIIEYGCDICTEHLAVEAKDRDEAENYAEESAWRLREGYEGLHGVLDYADFCEENELDVENVDSWERYVDMVSQELHYGAEVFDEENEDHLAILHDCKDEFFEI